MSNILITGGAGMIGSNLTKHLVRLGHNVKVVDNLWRGKIEYLSNEQGKPVIDLERNFFNRDLSIAGSCDDILHDIEFVYHLADVVAGIDYVFQNEGTIFRQNILINSNIISSVRNSKHIKGFVYVGTACSFPLSLQNKFEAVSLKEEDMYPAEPESGYGWSKLMGQYELSLLEKETGIPSVTLILHNVYGTPTDYGKRSQVIPALILKAINFPSEKFIVWGSGNQSRAFIHVNDVVDALELAMKDGLGHGIIQIGPKENTTIRELAATIVKISGKEISIEYDLYKPEGDKSRKADCSKAFRMLGWEPKVDLYEGLRKVYMWLEKKVSAV